MVPAQKATKQQKADTKHNIVFPARPRPAPCAWCRLHAALAALTTSPAAPRVHADGGACSRGGWGHVHGGQHPPSLLPGSPAQPL